MRKELIKILAAKISAIAKMQVEVNVLNSKKGGVIITIIIDGSETETTEAAQRIAQVSGNKFEDGGYDKECEAYFCGINE